MKPKVSIIIPVYNCADTLAHAAACALDQTEPNIQLVLVDDGSTDESAAVAEGIAASDKRVTFVRHDANRGRLEARRTGLLHADGEFTMFLDADDELLTDAVAQMLEVQDGVYDVVHFGFELRYAYAESPENKQADFDYCQPPAATGRGDEVTHIVFRDRRGPWSLCGKLMRTRLLREAIVHIPVARMQQSEDACLYFIFSCLADSYKGVPGYRGYVYNIDTGGSGVKQRNMTADQLQKSSCYRDSMDCIERFLRTTGRWDALRDDFRITYREHVQGGVSRLLERVAVSERPAGLDVMMDMWPQADVVDALAEIAWFYPAQAVNDIASARSLKCRPREVRTAAVYHSTMGVGGAERVTASLVNLWHDMGLNVVVFAEQERAQCAYDLPADVAWVTLPKSMPAKRGAYGQRAHVIAEAVKDYRIDVIVYQQWYHQLLPWDMVLFKSLGVPFSLYCHASLRTFFSEAHAWEFDQTRILRHADGIVVLSEFDKRFWESFNPHVWQVYNPVTVEPEAANVASLAGGGIVWVGRLSSFDKQPEQALSIFARVAELDEKCTLTMVGPAPSARMMSNLKAQARALGIDSRVVFVGKQVDVAAYLRKASVYLLTSRFESYCLALSEAKACGLPCVMYELPHLMLTQGNRGIVPVPQGDVESAAQEIVELLKDGEKRKRLGAEAFAHMSEVAAFDHRAFWAEVFSSLGAGSVDRGDEQERLDPYWDEIMEACKESIAKAGNPSLKSMVKQRGLGLARKVYHKLRR